MITKHPSELTNDDIIACTMRFVRPLTYDYKVEPCSLVHRVSIRKPDGGKRYKLFFDVGHESGKKFETICEDTCSLKKELHLGFIDRLLEFLSSHTEQSVNEESAYWEVECTLKKYQKVVYRGTIHEDDPDSINLSRNLREIANQKYNMMAFDGGDAIKVPQSVAEIKDIFAYMLDDYQKRNANDRAIIAANNQELVLELTLRYIILMNDFICSQITKQNLTEAARKRFSYGITRSAYNATADYDEQSDTRYDRKSYNEYVKYQNRKLIYPYMINHLRFDYSEITENDKDKNENKRSYYPESVFMLMDYLYGNCSGTTGKKAYTKNIYNLIHNPSTDATEADYADMFRRYNKFYQHAKATHADIDTSIKKQYVNQAICLHKLESETSLNFIAQTIHEIMEYAKNNVNVFEQRKAIQNGIDKVGSEVFGSIQNSTTSATYVYTMNQKSVINAVMDPYIHNADKIRSMEIQKRQILDKVFTQVCFLISDEQSGPDAPARPPRSPLLAKAASCFLHMDDLYDFFTKEYRFIEEHSEIQELESADGGMIGYARLLIQGIRNAKMDTDLTAFQTNKNLSLALVDFMKSASSDHSKGNLRNVIQVYIKTGLIGSESKIPDDIYETLNSDYNYYSSLQDESTNIIAEFRLMTKMIYILSMYRPFEGLSYVRFCGTPSMIDAGINLHSKKDVAEYERYVMCRHHYEHDLNRTVDGVLLNLLETPEAKQLFQQVIARL